MLRVQQLRDVLGRWGRAGRRRLRVLGPRKRHRPTCSEYSNPETCSGAGAVQPDGSCVCSNQLAGSGGGCSPPAGLAVLVLVLAVLFLLGLAGALWGPVAAPALERRRWRLAAAAAGAGRPLKTSPPTGGVLEARGWGGAKNLRRAAAAEHPAQLGGWSSFYLQARGAAAGTGTPISAGAGYGSAEHTTMLEGLGADRELVAIFGSAPAGAKIHVSEI